MMRAYTRCPACGCPDCEPLPAGDNGIPRFTCPRCGEDFDDGCDEDDTENTLDDEDEALIEWMLANEAVNDGHEEVHE